MIIADEDEYDEEEDEEEEDEEDETESKTMSTTGARPRRMSELKIPEKTKPIPDASSLFIFSKTNRWFTAENFSFLAKNSNLMDPNCEGETY